MTKTQCALIATAVLLASSQLALTQAPDAPAQPPDEYSEIAPLATHALVLDAVLAGSRMVVVGERGHVLLSDDQGKTWRQAKVPTRALLTAVYFHDDKLGWVVGHDETILRSEDGGETWTRTHAAPDKEQPLLDVWFKDADTGFAFGAYGTILASSDGGRSWTQQAFDPKPLIERPKPAASKESDEYLDEGAASDMHLNAVARADDGKLYLAAEAGHLFRSDDEGATGLELPSPYEGSFFGVLPLEGATVLAFGLRGHLYRSEDWGATWRETKTGTVAMLTNGLRVDSQTIVITGLAGSLLVSRDGGKSFELRQQGDRKGMSAALPAGDGRLLVVGESGIKGIEL
jgi:photosystem II stability/assembly factor-like uncharacterized protein